MEKVKEEESWNKKRIFAALFLLIALLAGFFFFKTYVLDINSDLSWKEDAQSEKSVKGVNDEENSDMGNRGIGGLKVDIQNAVKEKIDDLQTQVTTLDVAEIASSSPQIQKIINDIKSLEKYPTNQAKEICRQVCGL